MGQLKKKITDTEYEDLPARAAQGEDIPDEVWRSALLSQAIDSLEDKGEDQAAQHLRVIRDEWDDVA